MNTESKTDGSDNPHRPYHPYEVGTVCITSFKRTVSGPGINVVLPDESLANMVAGIAKSAYEAGKKADLKDDVNLFHHPVYRFFKRPEQERQLSLSHVSGWRINRETDSVSAKLDDGCWAPSAYRSGEEFFNECQHIVQEVGEDWVI